MNRRPGPALSCSRGSVRIDQKGQEVRESGVGSRPAGAGGYGGGSGTAPPKSAFMSTVISPAFTEPSSFASAASMFGGKTRSRPRKIGRASCRERGEDRGVDAYV